MNSFPIIGADELRTLIGFEDLIEPVSAAFQQTSRRLAENGLLVLRPGPTSASGDVYVKSGTLRGHRVFIVKISPWFAVNVTLNQPQGGFIGVFDSETGHTPREALPHGYSLPNRCGLPPCWVRGSKRIGSPRRFSVSDLSKPC